MRRSRPRLSSLHKLFLWLHNRFVVAHCHSTITNYGIFFIIITHTTTTVIFVIDYNMVSMSVSSSEGKTCARTTAANSSSRRIVCGVSFAESLVPAALSLLSVVVGWYISIIPTPTRRIGTTSRTAIPPHTPAVFQQSNDARPTKERGGMVVVLSFLSSPGARGVYHITST